MAIAITFDDGPNRSTSLQILALLEQLSIPATFFVLGYMIEKNPGPLKEIAASRLKHEIANHSWSHGNFEKMTDDQFKTEVFSVNDLIVKILGKEYKPKLLRPPKGQIKPEQRKMVEDTFGMHIVGWDVDSKDYSHKKTEARIINEIMLKTTDGKVILSHDIHAMTVASMKKALPALQKKFSFATVSQLGRYPRGGLTG